ncbi:MAG: hypothetical protein JW838_08175 [Spirochaetes bacterium]|nr:hypothetical protein [Spirochaetota bacterium]
MKKICIITAACLTLSGLIFSSCKKINIDDLEYQHITKTEHIQAYVKKKGGMMVLWFQVYDRSGNTTEFKRIQEPTVEIEGHPAKIKEDHWIIMMVNERIEIRLTAFGAVKDFQDTDKLKKFIRLFDLSGMAKISGPKLKAEELEKFIPVLGGK